MAIFEVFKRKIKRAEGGFSDNKNDRGNYNSKKEFAGTNFGISAKVYEKIIGKPPTVADMKNITQNEALSIFKRLFWDAIKADYIVSQKLAETFADHAINASPYYATKIMQRTLNNFFNKNLVEDGKTGMLTLEAINSVDEDELFIAYSQQRIEYYNKLSDCRYFCNSWHRRVHDLAEDYKVNISKTITPSSGKKKIIIVSSLTAILLLYFTRMLITKRKKNAIS